MKNKKAVFLLAGRGVERREIMDILDPEEKYMIKSELPFLGRRVVDFVVDELVKSKCVEKIYVVGQTADTLSFDYPVEYIPIKTDTAVIDKFDEIVRYMKEKGEEIEQFIVCTADSPAIKVEHIDEFIEAVQVDEDSDFIMSVVPIQREIEEFGKISRVVGNFTDHQVFPGEMYSLSEDAIVKGREIIEQISMMRKERNFLKTAWLVGKKPKTWWKLVRILLKRAKLQDAVDVFNISFKSNSRVVIIDDLGFGMDLDLAEDFEKLENYVKKTKPNSIIQHKK